MRNAGNGKLPWFKFFATDWLSDPYVRLMTSRQRGWYIDLLCWAWQEGGFFPNQAEVICQVLRDRQHIDYLAGTSESSAEEYRAIGVEFEQVLSHFTYTLPDGRVSHNKLEPQRHEAISLSVKHKNGADITNAKRFNRQSTSNDSERSPDTQRTDSVATAPRRAGVDTDIDIKKDHLLLTEVISTDERIQRRRPARANAAAAAANGIVLAPSVTAHDFPLTATALRNYYPAIDDGFITSLVVDAAAAAADVPDGAAAFSDKLCAEAVRHCAHQCPNQQSPGLFLTTVPRFVETALRRGLDATVPKPPQRDNRSRMERIIDDL